MLVNIIMLRDLGDTQCGIKAFRASVVPVVFKNQKIKGFAADIEWLFRASKNDLKIHWVKAEFRNAGQSSVVFWKQAIRMLRDVVRLRFNSIS
jgi:dolichyl-phosphate beta-glucosyltransferase